MTEEKVRKIVVFGVCEDHHAVYSEVLKDHKVIFAASHEEALTVGMGADVVAVNIDKHNGFFVDLFNRVFEGNVVAIATSRKLLNKIFELPDGMKLEPVCPRTAPEEIMRLLAA